MGDPDIRKLTDPYAPKRDNDSYVLTVGCLAHMLTALDTKLKLEWEPDERHELESKRNTLRTALFIPLDGLKRCNVELNTQAAAKAREPRDRKLQDPMRPSSTATDITA